MRVVSRQARGRWALVAAGTALLCGLPALVSSWPVPASTLSAAQLRARITSSAGVPYQGYVESNAGLGLPSLPDLGDIASLLDGTTDQYAWYSSATRWRADVLTTAGEKDTYQAGLLDTFVWDYSTGIFTQICAIPFCGHARLAPRDRDRPHFLGTEPVRLPRAADLLPPALAQRLVSYAGPGTKLSRLPAARIAGIDAVGLRLAPVSGQSVIRAVNIWADPHTGLAVKVEIFGRLSAAPVLVSKFLDVSFVRPAPAVVRPSPGPAVGFATSSEPDVTRILSAYGPPLPASLGGVSRVAGIAGLPDVAAYGGGFARFAVIPLPGRTGQSLLQAAASAGVTIQLGTGQAVVIQTPLLTVLITQPAAAPVYLLAGTVRPAVLEHAAEQLPGYQ